jgi:hypothetical protein
VSSGKLGDGTILRGHDGQEDALERRYGAADAHSIHKCPRPFRANLILTKAESEISSKVTADSRPSMNADSLKISKSTRALVQHAGKGHCPCVPNVVGRQAGVRQREKERKANRVETANIRGDDKKWAREHHLRSVMA